MIEMDALSRATRALLPLAPRFILRPVGMRYVAGETLQDAMRVVGELREAGATATLDILGEEVHQREQARDAAVQYVELVERLAREAPESTVSVKPTFLGLRMSRDLARENMERVFESASVHGIGVQMDMEDHMTTDDTLWLYEAMQRRFGSGGVALQARLRRTLSDAERIDHTGAIRLCKGIYPEPEDIAFTRSAEIDASYLVVLQRLLERGAYVGIATHDDHLVDRAEQMLRSRGLGSGDYEFQMLLGVRESLRERLIAAGHPVRVYVPFGRDWYAYSMRRLRESPQVAWKVLRSLMQDA